MPEYVEHPFAPLINSGSRILILGSLPSTASRASDFYYGHPRNRFWTIIARAFGEQVPRTIDEKKALILSHQLALWDVIASCDIENSSDASIQNVTVNDIAALVTKYPVEKILLNGKAAQKYYRKYLQSQIDLPVFTLPSTSPANAAWSLDRLLEVWIPALMQ